MFVISFQSSVIAIAQIFAVGAVGYFLVRKGPVDQSGLKLLSFLSVNVTFPFFIFYQITHNFEPLRMSFWWGYPLINIALTLTGLSLTALAFLAMRKPLKDEVLAASSLHNAGFIPLLLAMTLPLEDASGKVYAAVIISIIGFDLCLWSLGVWLMTRKQSPHMELKNMINPPLCSMAAAIVFVLLFGNAAVPPVLMKPVKLIGDSAMALAMLVIGGNLAMTKFTSIDARKLGAVVGLKLVALPVCALVALAFLRLDPIMSFVVMVQACMPTAITLSIIGRHYGTSNQDFINQSIFFTHVLCLVTVPVFLGIYGHWVH